jgi:hypothetical protein
MSTVTIAPHLQRALEAMSKDMAVEPQALVNQAIFAWLRINGYVLPGAPAQVVAPPPPPPVVVAPVPAVLPVVPIVAPPPPVVVEPVPAPLADAPPPSTSTIPSAPSLVAAVEAEAAAPMVSSPSAEHSLALARMKEIDADLERFARPWPAWVQAEEQEEEEQEEEAQEEAPPPEADEEESHTGETLAAPPADDEEADDEEEPGLDGNTGETEVEPPADSTVVLRSAPIALYLEREGEAPVRVQTDRFIIGRGPQCDLVIDSPRVSREHVALTRSGIRYFIEDLNSSNGTWYGEERVTKRELESGDVINLGNEPVTFILRAE